jgi:GGDEF domain-containing protein
MKTKYILVENKELKISIAKGFAIYDPDNDLCFNNVFKRADNAMYENKRKTKEMRV